MSPTRGGSLALLILISFISPSSAKDKIKCHSCIGEDCDGKGCLGDYCVLSSYSPRFGSSSLLKTRTQVKGCVNEEMISADIKDNCIEENEQDQLCFCNKAYCNFGKIQEREVTKEVKCKCNAGRNCKNGKCKGDLCVWTKDNNGKVAQGCMDLSVPLFERRIMDSCMIPPMTGSLHYHALSEKTFSSELLQTESCLCSTDNCNEEKPFTLNAEEVTKVETQSCDVFVRAKVKLAKGIKNFKTVKTTCEGEFCYKLNISSAEVGQLMEYESQGCATFDPKSKIDEEFSGKMVESKQCGEYKANGLKVRNCLRTYDKGTKKRLRESAISEEKEGENDYEGEGDESDEEEVEKTSKVKAKDGTSNGKKEEEKEEEKEKEKEEEEEEEKEEVNEKEGKKDDDEEGKKKNPLEEGEQNNIGEGGKAVTPAKHFVFVTPTDAPAPDESNATMITVFVLIILCICVAGITWKFQLHRKLMRGNYDTVAGG